MELSSICRNLSLYIMGGLFSKGVVNLKKVSLYIMEGKLCKTPCNFRKTVLVIYERGL